MHLLTCIGLEPRNKTMQGDTVLQTFIPQLQLQLLEQGGVGLHRPCQSEQLVTHLKLPVQVSELLTQFADQHIQVQIVKDLDTVIAVASPPSQSIPTKI